MSEQDSSHELAIRTAAAMLAAGASLLGPDAGAAATALAPAVEAALARVAAAAGQRRLRHAAETVADAAEASGLTVEGLLQQAVADDRRHELLSRALSAAQDAALRDKRRALGRALAAGIEGDNARIDDELLFIRAVADVDVPHIKLLKILSEDQPFSGQLSGSPFHGGWSLATVAARHPAFGGALPALVWGLESHALIQTVHSATPATAVAYTITSAGRQLLNRLTDGAPSRPRLITALTATTPVGPRDKGNRNHSRPNQ